MWSGSFSESNIGQHPSFSAVVGSLAVAEDEFSDAPDIKQGATDGGSFGPGGCVVTECAFTLSNGDGKFSGVAEGQDVTVSIGDDLMFTGSVCDIERQRSTIAVTCYGPMRTLDKKKFGTHTFTEETTVADIIGWIASDSGVTINTPSAGGNIVVNLSEDTAKELDLTCRQALQEVMQISGNFARDSRDGSIYCGWFDFSNVQKAFTEDTYYACSFKQAQKYTGVQIGSREVNGTADYLWRLDSNDFLTEDNAESVETRLAEILVGTSFSAGSLTALTDPRIEAGDVLSVTFAHGGSTSPMVFPVTSLTITNGLKESFSAEAMTADEAEDQRQKQSAAIANAAKQAARNSQANARGGKGTGSGSGSGSGSGTGSNSGLPVKFATFAVGDESMKEIGGAGIYLSQKDGAKYAPLDELVTVPISGIMNYLNTKGIDPNLENIKILYAYLRILPMTQHYVKADGGLQDNVISLKISTMFTTNQKTITTYPQLQYLWSQICSSLTICYGDYYKSGQISWLDNKQMRNNDNVNGEFELAIVYSPIYKQTT